ncbi:MAG TPA: Dabb family protein [Vicinamibacterales bacterium]|nr:Dabb family protein [Vicinamibacterales bacterium]
MIAHVVLLNPRADLSETDRGRALEALARAFGTIPGIRRFRLGRRVLHGLPGYEQQMAVDYQYALMLEFDGVADLVAYLRAPAHGALGHLFSDATAAALAYDYELLDAADVGGLCG